MALEEASQFVMEQSNEVYSSNVGHDYNLVELAPWNNDAGDPNANHGAYSEASAGYGTDTTNNPNTSLDDTMSVEYTHSDIKGQQVHTHGNTQPGVTSNMQYEISSATNLLYGSDQPCFEQDAYGGHGNHQFTNLQNRHQNMLGLLNSSTVNNLGPQNVQPINHWQNSSNSSSTNQVNAPRLGVNNLPLVPSVSQVTPQALYGSGIPSSGGSRGSQQLEKSFLEEMASIDLMPPMQGCTAVAANAAGIQDCSVINSSTSNAVPNVAPLPNTDAFVSQSIVPNSNTFTHDISSVSGGVSSNATSAPISTAFTNNGGEHGGIPASHPYSVPGTKTFGNTPLPVSGGGQVAKNAFMPGGGIARNNMVAANTMTSKPHLGTEKGPRQCPGCQQFFNHARNKYCGKCHERCATTPKNCVKCNGLFTSPNICRKLCDNCQKRPTNKPEELKRICSNCSQEFVTANSCRKYCDNCKTRSKEATTTKCATCNADFVRSKQLRKYCATCQIKDRGEIIQRKCLQCDNVYSDSNMNRKLCYTCRKHGSVVNTNAASQSWTRQTGNSTETGGVLLKSQYSSVKEYLAKSIIKKEICATAAKAEKAALTEGNAPSISCGKCGNYFTVVDPSRTLCNTCDGNSVPVAEISPKLCLICEQLFYPSDCTKTRCNSCDTLTAASSVECQKEFLPGVQGLEKCDVCATKRKELKVYAKCEKCSSPQNEGKRFCLNCQETKKKQNEPRKCEGCDNIVSHTPRKFCDSCREANEKPQVRQEQFNVNVP